MSNAGLEEAQAGIKTARRNINNLRYADDTTLMAESEEELKSLLMKVKEDLSYIEEGNGNPLHCSCLENPRDRALASLGRVGLGIGKGEAGENERPTREIGRAHV